MHLCYVIVTTCLLLLPLLPSTLAIQPTARQALNVTVSTVTVRGPTVTTYIATPTTPASPQYTDDLTFRTSLLNSTNFFRFQHNASFLAWNASLATYAQNYSEQCIWAHSHGPEGYGENLARGYSDITSAVDAWGNERTLYTFSPPSSVTGFLEATGHFTQLVWKATQTVGCGTYACNGTNDIGGYLLVCEYWPPGNIAGMGSQVNAFFEEEVQSQVVSGSSGYSFYSATMGAVGVGTRKASGTLVPTAAPSANSSNAGRRRVWFRCGLGMMVGVIAVRRWL